MTIFEKIGVALGVIGGFIAQALGGWDLGLQTLLACMGIDILTGLIIAIMGKSKNSTSGGFSSRVMFEGFMLKVLKLILVIVGQILAIFSGVSAVRDGVIIVLVVNECGSILENYTLTGLYVPPVLTKILDILKQKGDATNADGTMETGNLTGKSQSHN
jgi:toxin secretion/phage lysis holin